MDIYAARTIFAITLVISIIPRYLDCAVMARTWFIAGLMIAPIAVSVHSGVVGARPSDII
jgi:hypothetical protein